MDDELRQRAEGQPGPGLRPTPGIDKTLVTAWVCIVVGYTPWTLWRSLLGFGYFGPIQVPAIIAMVGVLFAVIAVLRAVDLHDKRLRTMGLVAGTLGLVRLFLLPLF